MIEIKKVSKRFDKIAAVSDVSLSIEQGQVFGLLGTNGAGKSTLLRMMAGVLKPEEVVPAPLLRFTSEALTVPDAPALIVPLEPVFKRTD